MGILFNFVFLTIFLIYAVSKLPSETEEVSEDFYLFFYPILYCLLKKRTKHMHFFSILKNFKALNAFN